MGSYVDGFVLVVPKGKEAEYEKMANEGRDAWLRNGALSYFECRGEDLAQQAMGDDKSRSFHEMAGAADDENVWFSFIVFESKEHRDAVNEKVMTEMAQMYKDESNMSMPFEMNRMAYGGFEVVVQG